MIRGRFASPCLVIPTLALLYSGIDTMAWLGLPDNQEDVTPEDFIQWADRYLFPDSGIPCTALDLYSSRCGIVHSMTAESRIIRQGIAKGVYYARGNHRPTACNSSWIGSASQFWRCRWTR